MPNQYTPEEVLEVMRKISLMSLAVSDKDNQPQSHMMLFYIDDKFNVFFATSKNSGKHKAIKENNKVALSVWSDKEMLVQIQGIAEEVIGDEVIKTVDHLADAAVKLPNFWPPVLQIMKAEYVVIKVTPKNIRTLDLTVETITSASTLFSNTGAQL